MRAKRAWQWLARFQAVFYFLTGIWPIVHINSFLAATGPKTDLWLVKTVGALICVFSLMLAAAARAGSLSLPVIIAGAGPAFVLMLVDVIYVTHGSISRIYLLDAAVELALIAAWMACIFAVRKPRDFSEPR